MTGTDKGATKTEIKQAAEDFKEGVKYGEENPIDSASHILHKGIGTAPERSEEYERGVEVGKKNSQN